MTRVNRTKLCDRILPDYTRGEEILNTTTHIIGGAFSVAALALCVVFAARHKNVYGIISSVIYGVTMIALYTVSSVYHGMPAGMGKKVMQVIDHCTIYSMIAGTYTVMALSALRPMYPKLGWGIFAFEWVMAIFATVLTAIDLRKYRVLSMVCYIGLGWAIIPFARQTYTVLTRNGFLFLLWGGIAYTIGAVMYGIGSKKRWMHSVFHIFVVLGSVLQFFAVLLYAV